MADSSPAPRPPPSASTPSPVPPPSQPPLQTLQQLPTQTELQTPSVIPSLIKVEKPGSTAATPELSTTDAQDIPAAASTVSYTIIIPSCSAWFSWDEIHDTERRLLPEFFDGKSTSRKPTSYKYLRDAIISRFRSQPTRKLTYTEARRGLVGDIGSIRKVFDFLEEWGLINYTPPKKGKEEPESRGVERKDGSYGKRMCTSCGAVCSLQCFTTAKANMTLCAKCFVKSNYQRPGLNSADFKRVDLLEDPRPDWTDKETLHLLEAILHYGKDWKKVAEYVASRPAKDCIARFVKLSFGEQFIGLKEENNGNPEHGEDEADESESVKKRRLSPLADASNPIMAQVAFLSAIVGLRVAENAAQAAICALSNLDTNEATDLTEPSVTETKEEASELNDPIATAHLEMEKEQQDLEQSISEIIEVQMKEMQEKIVQFEEMESIIERERLQVQYMKDLLLADQLAVAQHQHRGAMMARDNVNSWEKLKSINDVIDRGTTLLL